MWPHIIILDPFNAGLAAARTMVRLGARVTVVEGQVAVSRSRGVHGITSAYKVDGEEWLSVLDRLSAGAGEGVILTGTDRASAWLVQMADLIPGNLRFFERSGEAHLALMDKQRADRIARAAGVNVPWTAHIADENELAAALKQARWPCVVKPALSHKWRDHYGAKRSFFVSDPDEALRLMEEPLRAGFQMLLSQYIPGEDDDVEEAIVVRLADGSYPVRFGCRKLRQYPRGFGETAVGESSMLPETTALAERVLAEAGFVGVAGVESKRHAHTGERWFLEVNVRLPGQWGLGDACGAHATPRLIRALSGQDQGEQPPIATGVRFVQFDLDWHSLAPALKEQPLRMRPLTLWRFTRPYLGARELGIIDPRDPGPLLARARVFIARRVGRLWARVKRMRRPVI